ncbi:MAG TPA: DUF5752 family protein [Chlamydiales bacterium]|nr:MAG: hypothetical protein A3F67_11955 [Verrucomicrobia bacterium RIFCSPHIGHO2_12_FULL_41_10]HLB52600.1 DUF5752 family protein [Chlamydiales bacterium]
MSTAPLFQLKDCNLALMATGISAESLQELRDRLYEVPIGSLYYHFWGGRLRVSFVHPEYHNDFAFWAHTALHDEILTERFSIIDPTEYGDLEDLRRRVIDVIEERLDESEFVAWSRKEQKFHFLRSITIVYDLELKTTTPIDLKQWVEKMTPTTIFYHFIDARRRTKEHFDDFSLWLSEFGDQYKELIGKIRKIDPYFLTLSEIRSKLNKLFEEHL